MSKRVRGGDGEAEGDETKQDKMCKTPSGECVYKRVHRDEEGLQHLEVYTSEEVSHISCLPSPNIDRVCFKSVKFIRGSVS